MAALSENRLTETVLFILRTVDEERNTDKINGNLRFKQFDSTFQYKMHMYNHKLNVIKFIFLSLDHCLLSINICLNEILLRSVIIV